MIAARRLHWPLMSAQIPSPRSTSDVSFVVVTVKVAASTHATLSITRHAVTKVFQPRALMVLLIDSTCWMRTQPRIIPTLRTRLLVALSAKEEDTGRRRQLL